MTFHIGNAIERRLKETGMSNAEFARRIGTSRQNVSLIFLRSSIHVDQLARICDVLDYDFLDDIPRNARRNPKRVFLTFEVNPDELPPHIFGGMG